MTPLKISSSCIEWRRRSVWRFATRPRVSHKPGTDSGALDDVYRTLAKDFLDGSSGLGTVSAAGRRRAFDRALDLAGPGLEDVFAARLAGDLPWKFTRMRRSRLRSADGSPTRTSWTTWRARSVPPSTCRSGRGTTARGCRASRMTFEPRTSSFSASSRTRPCSDSLPRGVQRPIWRDQLQPQVTRGQAR